MIEIGYITVYIDSITPCLQEVESGKLVNTEVTKITKISALKNYNKKNGWYIN